VYHGKHFCPKCIHYSLPCPPPPPVHVYNEFSATRGQQLPYLRYRIEDASHTVGQCTLNHGAELCTGNVCRARNAANSTPLPPLATERFLTSFSAPVPPPPSTTSLAPERRILKRTLRKFDLEETSRPYSSGQGRAGGFCEHGDEPSRYRKGGELLY
jgi:hypothetical protein